MFEDSLLESGGKYSTLTSRAPWAPVASFTFEAALIGVLLLIPLIYTDALPRLQLTRCVLAPPPGSSSVQVEVRRHSAAQSEMASAGRILAPRSIPPQIAMNVIDPDPLPGGVSGILGATGAPGTMPIGIPDGLLRPVTIAPVVPPHVEPHQRVKVSAGVTAGLLVHNVPPIYPPMAKLAHISGEVVLQAVIAKDGSIQNLRLISGHPMLVQSAIDAVRQWKYRPYLLNGEPVEVDTLITVNFSLTRS